MKIVLLICCCICWEAAPPAGSSYCVGVHPADCPYAWTFWEGRWVYNPFKDPSNGG
jgi:hypothetical protein